MDPTDQEEPMDEHDVPPDDATPAPPPFSPVTPFGSLPDPAPFADPPARSSTPRLVAAGTAVALVVAAGGLGFALGRGHGSTGTAGGRVNPGAGSPFGGQVAPGGEGQGGTPFSGPGTQGGGGPADSSAGGTPASDTQLTGLVRIATTLKYQGGLAAGTGMVLTSTGEVVTNHHVVQGATKITVTVMSTGRQYAATVVGTDATDDVAVLQLTDATGLATVQTDTNAVSVGDAVTAVGDAGGSNTAFTAAAGTVSATDQHITTQSEDGRSSEKLDGLIEISSDVISGDSGGATYDDQGDVIAMTTAASSGGRDIVGYAVPITRVLKVAGDLENGVQSTRYDYSPPAFAGLSLEGKDTTVAGTFPGTPAAQAGITTGDTIKRVGSTRVRSSAGLRRAITSYSPGDRVTLAWTDQAGVTHVAALTLIAGPVA